MQQIAEDVKVRRSPVPLPSHCLRGVSLPGCFLRNNSDIQWPQGLFGAARFVPQASLSAAMPLLCEKMSCKVLKDDETLLETRVRFQQQNCALHKVTKERKFSPWSWGDKTQITQHKYFGEQGEGVPGRGRSAPCLWSLSPRTKNLMRCSPKIERLVWGYFCFFSFFPALWLQW